MSVASAVRAKELLSDLWLWRRTAAAQLPNAFPGDSSLASPFLSLNHISSVRCAGTRTPAILSASSSNPAHDFTSTTTFCLETRSTSLRAPSSQSFLWTQPSSKSWSPPWFFVVLISLRADIHINGFPLPFQWIFFYIDLFVFPWCSLWHPAQVWQVIGLTICYYNKLSVHNSNLFLCLGIRQLFS